MRQFAFFMAATFGVVTSASAQPKPTSETAATAETRPAEAPQDGAAQPGSREAKAANPTGARTQPPATPADDTAASAPKGPAAASPAPSSALPARPAASPSRPAPPAYHPPAHSQPGYYPPPYPPQPGHYPDEEHGHRRKGKPAVTAMTAIGASLTGLGLTTVLAGGIVGIVAAAETTRLDRECPNKTCVEGTRGAEHLADARDAAQATDVVLMVGASVAGAGIAILILTPVVNALSAKTSSPRFVAGPNGMIGVQF